MEQQKSETIEVTICFLDFATNYTFHYGMKAGNDSLVEWRSWEDTQVVTTINESLFNSCIGAVLTKKNFSGRALFKISFFKARNFEKCTIKVEKTL